MLFESFECDYKCILYFGLSEVGEEQGLLQISSPTSADPVWWPFSFFIP
jgi:hypothetical protein